MATIPELPCKTTAGQAYSIRTAQPDDAEAMLAYIRPIAEDTKFFVLEADEFPTVDEEQDWIQDHLDHPGKLLLLAEADGQLIGNISFETGPRRRISHRGDFGLSVARAWRGRGVGTTLIKTLLKWAASNPLVEKVCLDVFATNTRAIRLYRKLGFVEEGRRIKDIKRGPNDYVDTLMMGRFVQ